MDEPAIGEAIRMESQQEDRIPACQGTERGGVGQGLWVRQHTLFNGSQLPYGRRMNTAGQLIVDISTRTTNWECLCGDRAAPQA